MRIRGLIHEEDAPVSSAEYSYRSRSAPTDQRRGGAAVVGRFERGRAVESFAAVELSPQRAHRRRFDGLLVIQWWKYPRQALCQQRLSGSWGASHQQIVSTGGGDFETESSFGLALDFDKVVTFGGFRADGLSLDDRWQLRDRKASTVDIDELCQ